MTLSSCGVPWQFGMNFLGKDTAVHPLFLVLQLFTLSVVTVTTQYCYQHVSRRDSKSPNPSFGVGKPTRPSDVQNRSTSCWLILSFWFFFKLSSTFYMYMYTCFQLFTKIHVHVCSIPATKLVLSVLLIVVWHLGKCAAWQGTAIAACIPLTS